MLHQPECDSMGRYEMVLGQKEKRLLMTDNRTTELLCKLLDERGVSCQTHYLHASWCVGSKLYDAVDNLDGTLTVSSLTPEQAIAATLGSGTLTAERLEKAKACKSSEELAALAAELIAERHMETCEMEYQTDGMMRGWWKCSVCGEAMDTIKACAGREKPKYCGNCGRLVVA